LLPCLVLWYFENYAAHETIFAFKPTALAMYCFLSIIIISSYHLGINVKRKTNKRSIDEERSNFCFKEKGN
jgi:hypothetical protein